MKHRLDSPSARNSSLPRLNPFFALALAAVWALSGLASALAAQQNPEHPFLHPLFSDHLVLQRGTKAPVWGWATPGVTITVSFADQKKTVVVPPDGKWMVRLNPLRASAEPRTLVVSSSDGNCATIQDVLVGDVWLCSGQSNMEMGIGNCNVPDQIAQADYPQIRLITVPKHIAAQPVDTFPARWQHCSPASVAQGGWGGFSAAGYFFGRELYRQLNIPIGLIHSSWGGTIAEAWTSAESLSPLGDFNERLAKVGTIANVSDKPNPNVVTVLYNGMIAPLLPFAIKGAIWYQGESNADRANQYRRLLPAMIQDWRSHFGVGAFPFYIVQLANFQAVAEQPRDNAWAELREAQALTAKKVPHSGLAVAIDIGDAKDIHPKNKAEVGRRLALWALAKDYGKKVECSGPWYKSMKLRGDSIRLSFDHIDGGLVARGGELKGFAIAGEDHKFVWANAVIEKNQIVVSSPAVAKPVAVRYAWDINPVCNLFNQSGLPAVPFRTDDWPMLTQNKK